MISSDMLEDLWQVQKQFDLTFNMLIPKNLGEYYGQAFEREGKMVPAITLMYDDLKNSTGSAEAEQARYMDSIEAKMNALKETTKGVFIRSINSNDIKAVLDIATSGVSVIGKLVESFGALPTTITAVSMALSIFNSKSSGNL